MNRFAIASFALLLATITTGCGAKTGLNVPDLGPEQDLGPMDMGVDMGPDMSIPCIEVPFDGGPVDVELETEAQVGRADVVFLIDRTLSMEEEIGRIRDRLRDLIAPAIFEAIPDSQLGVASFADFPVGGFGSAADGDTPFTLHSRTTSEVEAVQAAVNAINLSNGLDRRESQTEAMFQLATGAGIGDFVPPSVGCPSGGIGYACVRSDALPVVMLFTDAEFHQDPSDANSFYTGIVPRPHDYNEAILALNNINARVIGFNSGSAGAILGRTARDTGAVDDRGNTLVFDIGASGQRLTAGVVDAIRTFASTFIQDVDVVPSDPDLADGVDVLEFIEAITPLRAVPMSNIEGIDVPAGAFRGVLAGTELVFQITVRNDVVAPGVGPQRFRLELLFRGDERSFISRQIVEIVVPGADGAGCDEVTAP